MDDQERLDLQEGERSGAADLEAAERTVWVLEVCTD
jgi:hypothetical protein